VTGLDVTDPANFTLGILGDIYTHHTSDGESGRIDFEYYPELTYLQTLQFGARYSERTSDQIGATEILPLPPDPLSEFPELAMVSPASGFAIAAALPMSDMQKLRSSFGLAPGPADPSPSQEYSLTEKTYAGYGRIIYEFGLGDIEVDGDLGVRVVETKTDAEGAAVIAGGDTVATLKESSYTDVLPSASIRFRLSPEFTLRASASKTVTRPDFLSLSPTLNLSSTTGTGSGGNPDLKAFTTSGADLALEWYFSNSGYATAGIFYKDVDGFLQNESRIEEIGGTPYVITRPVQGSEGHVKGVELQYSHRFIDLPGLLSNLGLNANYTYIDSEQPVEGTEETIQIVGLSKDTVNLGVYYASDPLFVRFGYNYRSGFLQNVANLDAIPGQNEYGSQTFMDATVQYTFTPKVAVVANVLNIAQPTTGYFKMDPLIPSNRFKTYRRYEVGVRLTF
jgi:TonB-dependent receptor